jgi:hypothetical protein
MTRLARLLIALAILGALVAAGFLLVQSSRPAAPPADTPTPTLPPNREVLIYDLGLG